MLHVVGLLTWRVVIYRTTFSAGIAVLHSHGLNLACSSPGFKLNCCCYFHSPVTNRSTSLFSSFESSFILSITKPLRLYQQKSDGCSKPRGRAPHIFSSNWGKKKYFSSYCFSTFWRDGNAVCTVLWARSAVLASLCHFPLEAALLVAVLILLRGITLALRLRLRAIFSLILIANLNAAAVSFVTWL